MANEPGYRFLPWTRRGLAAGITVPDGADVTAHANVAVGITVSGAGDVSADLRLYGAGDIIGIDPRLIVRMEPRANATDVEPNYLVAIEFDPPDLPWLFTPAAPAPGDRLRPWCVLVVVDNAVVAPPHLESGLPLPVIDVPAYAALTELPDLAESWVWAHTQVLTTETTPAALRAELNGAPDRQLSRLICPRRLAPSKHYCACLVPAFAVGVQRGLGGVPDDDATLTAAWTLTSLTDVRLPVYFHWEFATGPQGDFESLARALRPYKCEAGAVGVEKMFVGGAGPGVPALDAEDPAATLVQDGALRAPLAVSGTLADVPEAIADGLRDAVNAPSAQLAGRPDATPTLGPPLYGEWHTARHALAANVPAWLTELNLDPRARVAAGLGAEIVRANQESFMAVCWKQVGKVIDANEALSRGRLALESARRLHERHFQPLPTDLLAQLTSPLHTRVRHGTVTVRKAIAGSSVPDATADAALRRLTSGQRPVLKKTARRRGEALPPSRTARPRLVRSLAAGRQDVDPGRFTPGGLVQLDFLDAVGSAPQTGTVDLTPFGVPMQVAAAQFQQLSARYADLSSAPSHTTPAITVRTDIQATGMVTAVQLNTLSAVSVPAATTVVDRRALVGDLLTMSAQSPGAAAYLITVGNRSGQWRVDPLDVDIRGQVVVRATTGGVAVPIATVSAATASISTAALGSALAALPSNSLDRRGRTTAPLATEVAAVGTASLQPMVAPPALGGRVTDTVAPLNRDPIVLQRFQAAFHAASTAMELSLAEPTPELVPFDLAAVGKAMLSQTDPRQSMRLRTASRIHVGGLRVDQGARDGVTVAPTFDRIMVAPKIVAPLYELLAGYDRTRLLPGVDRIPNDGITLLETNPRFIEAFLVGANHEMNRELLWRRYPTDQRGTTLPRFWEWLDGGDDIPAIHTFEPTGALGAHTRGSTGGQLVLLIRGRLLRRYPNSVIYAWRAQAARLKDPPADSDLRTPMFAGRFPPDITFVGFDLTFEEAMAGDGWFFVIQQQPTEPRFGFDEPDAGATAAIPVSWFDATWLDADVIPGRHLTLAGNPLAGVTLAAATFGRDAAHLAAVLLQKPMRVALHARQLAELG
jgi:hypothetical protein